MPKKEPDISAIEEQGELSGGGTFQMTGLFADVQADPEPVEEAPEPVEEDDDDFADLTKQDLSDILTEREVEHSLSSRKDDLIALVQATEPE